MKLGNLKERLLRAGVAPRHVRRYLRELQDHYDDALRHELQNGAPPELAARRALERLGPEDALADCMLADRRCARPPHAFRASCSAHYRSQAGSAHSRRS